MASIKLKFRPSTVPDKEGTLYFQVLHRRSVRLAYTDYHIKPDEWDEKASFIRITGTPERQAELRLAISQILWDSKQLTTLITEKEQALAEYTADDIVSAFKLLPPCRTWFDFIHSMIAQKMRIGRNGTAKTYRDALASFSLFRDGEDITIDALDTETMNLYEAWLKGRGVKRNSSSCYLRTLRTLYRKAVEAGLTTDKNIFRHVFTGFAKTTKRAIPLDYIRTIKQLQLPEGSPQSFARDMFILCIYLQGISFVDMAYLKKNDIKKRQTAIQPKKNRTGSEHQLGTCHARHCGHIRTPDHRKSIPVAYHYRSRRNRTYPIRTDGTQSELSLKKIGTMAGLQMPLTTYTGRHSWASTMRDMGVSLSVISKGLGHESLKTTQIYLSSIDTEGVAKANRKMIGKILRP